MNKTVKIIKYFSIITVPTLLVLFIFLELFFRWIIPSCEMPTGFFDEESKIFRYQPNEKGVYTIGKFADIKAKWISNNAGWIYPRDYIKTKTKKRIAVIGDSYIEALQVDFNKNYPFLLNDKLGNDYEIYSFGKREAPLSQYLNMSRYVVKNFNPDILIFNIVHNDFDESIYELNPNRNYFMRIKHNSLNNNITETEPVPNHSFAQYNFWKRFFYQSATLRYFYYNLEIFSILKSSDAAEYESNVIPNILIKNKDMIALTTEYILNRLRVENPQKRVIFVFDAPRQAIYDRSLAKSKVLWLYDMVEHECKKNNIEFIDLTKPMELQYLKNNINYNSALDYHWNDHGHRFVANILYEYLKNTE